VSVTATLCFSRSVRLPAADSASLIFAVPARLSVTLVEPARTTPAPSTTTSRKRPFLVVASAVLTIRESTATLSEDAAAAVWP
jgi:hypothetical protein